MDLSAVFIVGRLHAARIGDFADAGGGLPG
jgi:hypothetical protein